MPTISTSIWQALTDSDEIAEKALENTPLGRFGNPEEMGGIVSFLASDEVPLPAPCSHISTFSSPYSHFHSSTLTLHCPTISLQSSYHGISNTLLSHFHHPTLTIPPPTSHTSIISPHTTIPQGTYVTGETIVLSGGMPSRL